MLQYLEEPGCVATCQFRCPSISHALGLALVLLGCVDNDVSFLHVPFGGLVGPLRGIRLQVGRSAGFFVRSIHKTSFEPSSPHSRRGSRRRGGPYRNGHRTTCFANAVTLHFHCYSSLLLAIHVRAQESDACVVVVSSLLRLVPTPRTTCFFFLFAFHVGFSDPEPAAAASRPSLCFRVAFARHLRRVWCAWCASTSCVHVASGPQHV